jgi:hypothetical protein
LGRRLQGGDRYRGGPAGANLILTNWTSQEEANLNELLKGKLLMVSQANGAVAIEYESWGYTNFWWTNDSWNVRCQRITGQLMTHYTDQNFGLTSNERPFSPRPWVGYAMMGTEMFKAQPRPR